jgi:hypothetical protein
MVAGQLYGAVSSHSQDLEHSHKQHHLNYTKNLGTIYIIDNIMLLIQEFRNSRNQEAR